MIIIITLQLSALCLNIAKLVIHMMTDLSQYCFSQLFAYSKNYAITVIAKENTIYHIAPNFHGLKFS